MKRGAKLTLEKFAARQRHSTCSWLVDEECGYDGKPACPCHSEGAAGDGLIDGPLGAKIKPNKKVLRPLDEFGRIRLSEHYFMRDFLYSEIAAAHGIANVPCNVELAVEAGKGLCENLLEPLHSIFGHITIRSAFRSVSVNGFGNCHKMSCSSNNKSYANHIWDHEDRRHGYIGATACIVIPWFVDWLEERPDRDWRSLAWFIHDHLPYSGMVFFPENAACNLTWRCSRSTPDRPRSEDPRHKVRSYPEGILTAPGMSNYTGLHDRWYPDFPDLTSARERARTLRPTPQRHMWPDYLQRACELKSNEDMQFKELCRLKVAGESNPAFAVWRSHWVQEVDKAWKRADKGKGTFRERETWYEGELAASRDSGADDQLLDSSAGLRMRRLCLR